MQEESPEDFAASAQAFFEAIKVGDIDAVKNFIVSNQIDCNSHVCCVIDI